jgi:hypothetical protein
MGKFKYRVWCNTESDYVYVWADSPPSECPNNHTHSINTDNIAYVQVREEIILDPINGPDLKILSPDGTLSKKITLDNSGSLNLDDSKINANGSNEIIVTFTDSTRPYVKRTNNSYDVMAYVIFNGTQNQGSPVCIQALSWSKSSSKDYSIKIIRQDTGDTVCEVTGQTNDQIQIVDFGVISNLPTVPTIFEVHGKCQKGGECRIASLSIKF